MSNTRDLINAISTGDSVGIESAFNAAMAEKITSKLDDMRVGIAQNMFNEQPAEPTVTAEEVELDEEQLDELVGKGKLSDIEAAHKSAGDTSHAKALKMKSDSGYHKHNDVAQHHYYQAARASALKSGDREHAKEIDAVGKGKDSAVWGGKTPQGKKIDYHKVVSSVKKQSS